jgi:peptidylprolyl isomerase
MTASALSQRVLFALAVIGLAACDRPAATAPEKAPAAAKAPAVKTPPAAEILAASPKADWRALEQENLLYMDLPKGRVIIELAPAFAQEHVVNIKTLVGERYFDGLSILRAQDNFVVQWGDPDEEKPKPIGTALAKVIPEFTRPSLGLDFTKLPDRDVYADEVGFTGGMPVAHDLKSGDAWLVHCYGMVATARDSDPTTGNGSQLYAIIGHAPRHLDRNLTVVGRVVQGIELLSSLPRGTEALGFYAKPSDRTPIRRVRMGSDLPPAEQVPLEALRTDTKTFETLAEARRNRTDDFYKVPAGHIELCNVPLPVRPIKP